MLKDYHDANDDVDVRDAERSDAGQYFCRAENLVGSRDSDPARLSVHSKSFRFLDDICCVFITEALLSLVLEFLSASLSYQGCVSFQVGS